MYDILIAPRLTKPLGRISGGFSIMPQIWLALLLKVPYDFNSIWDDICRQNSDQIHV